MAESAAAKATWALTTAGRPRELIQKYGLGPISVSLPNPADPSTGSIRSLIPSGSRAAV